MEFKQSHFHTVWASPCPSPEHATAPSKMLNSYKHIFNKVNSKITASTISADLRQDAAPTLVHRNIPAKSCESAEYSQTTTTNTQVTVQRYLDLFIRIIWCF